MLSLQDTIVAISSATGGIRGIVRLSGPHAHTIAQSIVNTAPPALRPLISTLTFHAPRSFTGEDVAELHAPGSSPILHLLLDAALSAGARRANPGEFSARAFFHNKIDLTEAEGIAATISAGSQQELRAAAALRNGHLHRWVEATADHLANTLALVEAGIDFVDEEDVSFIDTDTLTARLRKTLSDIDDLLHHAIRWEGIGSAPTVVLTGKPNVGKSSLLNALSGQARAIVSPIAGTTRDAIGITVTWSGHTLRLVDVAGIEDEHTDIQRQMNAARRRALAEADLILLIVDHETVDVSSQQTALLDLAAAPIVTVHNKSDLPHTPTSAADLIVSAATGAGLDALRAAILDRVIHNPTQAATAMTLNARHRAALLDARSHLNNPLAHAAQLAKNNPEILAADLRQALDALGSISGTISPDDVLGRIFSHFCIGK